MMKTHEHLGPHCPAAMPCAPAWHVTVARSWMPNGTQIERYSLNQWLQAHREHFVTFTIEEIAEMAIAYGYTNQEVESSILKRDRRFL